MKLCKITPARRADDSAWLNAMLATYQGPVTKEEGFACVAPLPPRRDWIDPDLIPKRSRSHVSPRSMVRMIAALSTHDIEGKESLRSAGDIARILREQGTTATVALVEMHAKRHGIVLRAPCRQWAPDPEPVRGTRQARQRAVLAEAWP